MPPSPSFSIFFHCLIYEKLDGAKTVPSKIEEIASLKQFKQGGTREEDKERSTLAFTDRLVWCSKNSGL